MSAPVLSQLLSAQGVPKGATLVQQLSPYMTPLTTQGHQIVSVRPRISEQGPTCPALRANPYSKVMDQCCRLPLPTLSYGPEAANLGDLLRFWERPGAWFNLVCGSSGTAGGTLDTSADNVIYPPKTLSPGYLISGSMMVKKKRQRFPRPPAVAPQTLHVAMTYTHPD